jgi:hypothetical protein
MASTLTNGSGTGRSPRTLAVVFCAPGKEAPGTLLDALARRGVEPLVVHDAFGATLLTARASEHGSPALIVVEPAAHRAPLIEDLVRSVRRRFPGVVIWRFDASARPPLRAFSDVGVRSGAGTNGSSPVVVRKAAPSLRLTDHPRPASPLPAPSPDSSARDPDAATERETPSALLSEEELAMLLSDDLDPPTR